MQCQELNPPVPCKVHLPSLLAAVIAVLLAVVVLVFAPPAAAGSVKVANQAHDPVELCIDVRFEQPETRPVRRPR